MCYFDYDAAFEAAAGFGLGHTDITKRVRHSDGAVFWVVS